MPLLDALGSTFGSRIALGYDNQTERTCLCTFATTDTFLFIDHVNALCILGDRTFRTCLCAFSALRTGDRADCLLLYDLQTPALSGSNSL